MKPMKAASERPNLSGIKYPKLASTKLDGIRCVAVNGVAYSAAMKLIPNQHVQKFFSGLGLHALDGELMVHGDFNDVQSAIMSVGGTPDFTFNVFDLMVENVPYDVRLGMLIGVVDNLRNDRVLLVQQFIASSEAEVLDLYDQARFAGHEGLILRDPASPYKYGRSTLKQEWMLKLKPSDDAEGTVVNVVELMHENGQPGGVMGALIVEFNGHVVGIGTGFDQSQRASYWAQRHRLIGELATFKYMELSRYGIPRHPVFKGFRSKLDV